MPFHDPAHQCEVATVVFGGKKGGLAIRDGRGTKGRPCDQG